MNEKKSIAKQLVKLKIASATCTAQGRNEYLNLLNKFVSIIKTDVIIPIIPSESFIIQFNGEMENLLHWCNEIINFEIFDINESVEKAIKSDLLMALIRSLALYIKTEYFEEFKSLHDEGTINTQDPRIKVMLTEDERESGEWRVIYAYSFGPFDSFAYFNSDLRILVIDWEPYMLPSDIEKLENGEYPYLGGHDQSYYYPTKAKLEAVTHINAIDFSHRFIKQFTSLEVTEDEIMKNNICILNHNFFPALALKTDGSNKSSNKVFMTKISELTRNVIALLIRFYSATLVLGTRDFLGGDDPKCLIPNFNSFLIPIKRTREEWKKIKILDRSILIAGRIQLKKYKCVGIKDETGCIWIGYAHFSRGFWKGKNGEAIIQWIRNHRPKP